MDTLPEHRSEPLEVSAAHFIGVQWKRCELTKAKFDESDDYMDQLKWDHEIASLWYGIQALKQVNIAATGTSHFSVALSNETRHIDQYIEDTTGYCPILKTPVDHRHYLCLSEY